MKKLTDEEKKAVVAEAKNQISWCIRQHIGPNMCNNLCRMSRFIVEAESEKKP